MAQTTSPKGLAILLLAVLSVIWGSSFLLMKLGLEAFSPLQVAALRLVVASLVLLPFLVRYLGQVNLREMALLAVIGFTGNGLPSFLFVKAETVIPTSVAGVLNALTPIFTILIAYVFFKTRFAWLSLVGIATGLVGTLLLVTAGNEELALSRDMQYSLLIVLATINYAISLNLTKTFFQEKSPVLITTFALVSMGIPSAIFLLVQGNLGTILHQTPGAWEALGYVVVLGAVGTAIAVVLFYKMLQISNLIFATSVTYTIPVVALLWGIFFLGEQLSAQHYLGFAIVLAGVYLVNYSRQR